MDYEDFLREWNGPLPFIEVSTSGSTGSPKVIELEKTFLKESALRTINFFGLNHSARFHSCISPDFIGGKMMAVRASAANASLSWEMPSNSPLDSFPSGIPIDLLAVVPSQIAALLERKNLPVIRNIIIGGAPIPEALRMKIATSGFNAFETYGMTETASHIALRKVVSEKIPFKTLPSIKVQSDPDGALNIIFDNGSVVKTNDIAEIISDTEFFILGRKDLIINTGGKKVNPIDLENSISHLIDNPYMISSLPDDKWGEKIILIIQDDSDSARQEYLRQNLILSFKKEFESWKIPKEIIFVKKIPLTSNGKIRRIRGQELTDYLSDYS